MKDVMAEIQDKLTEYIDNNSTRVYEKIFSFRPRADRWIQQFPYGTFHRLQHETSCSWGWIILLRSLRNSLKRPVVGCQTRKKPPGGLFTSARLNNHCAPSRQWRHITSYHFFNGASESYSIEQENCSCRRLCEIGFFEWEKKTKNMYPLEIIKATSITV